MLCKLSMDLRIQLLNTPQGDVSLIVETQANEPQHHPYASAVIGTFDAAAVNPESCSVCTGSLGSRPLAESWLLEWL
jgi:hypothetical protein